MKVALVILHADAARGGAERYTMELAEALAQRGHHVSLLASTFAATDSSIQQIPLSASGPTRLRHYLCFLDALDAHLGEMSYDVVHAMLPVRRCDIYHPHAGIAAEAVARGHLKYRDPLRRAVARAANRVNRKRQRFATVERRLLIGEGDRARSPDDGPILLCLSDYVKRTVQTYYPQLPEARLATLLNATDLQKFDPAARPGAGAKWRERFGIAPDRVVALMIAQDFARKGLHEAIAAWREVNDPRLVLLVVGKDDPRPYQRLLTGPNVKNVIFAGATDDPYAAYQSADFFVLPTRHDPCSLVVLEALAMGVPVISTIFNGATEIMQHARHGYVLADPANVSTLAQSMRDLLDDGRRHAMRQACLALRPTLAYSTHLDRLLQIYANCRSRRSP